MSLASLVAIMAAMNGNPAAADGLAPAARRALAAFVAHLRDERGLSPHTVAAYRRDLAWIADSAEMRAFDSLSTAELEPWLADNEMGDSGKTIGVVTIAGTIVDGDAGPGSAGGDRIAKVLDEALDDVPQLYSYLQELLRTAKVGDAPASDAVAPGMVVTIYFDDDADDTETFLLGSREISATTELTVYSPESALGKAILGGRPGQAVTYTAPSGADIKVTIVSFEPFAG